MICGTCACKKEKILTSKIYPTVNGELFVGDIPATFCECGIHVSYSVEMELEDYINEKNNTVTGIVHLSYNEL
ncbi:hypothetical protein ACFSY7_05420 [Kurthia populi]|uniref:YgiT-type zinc finger domain n=1 Tax=Kurthia populi TaxID=1562132 RepID=A0ABW5XY49_9BACL